MKLVTINGDWRMARNGQEWVHSGFILVKNMQEIGWLGGGPKFHHPFKMGIFHEISWNKPTSEWVFHWGSYPQAWRSAITLSASHSDPGSAELTPPQSACTCGRMKKRWGQEKPWGTNTKAAKPHFTNDCGERPIYEWFAFWCMLKMVLFHGYMKWPEGRYVHIQLKLDT